MARKKDLGPIRREIAATAGKLFEMTGISPEKCSKDQREVLAAFAFGFALTPHVEKFKHLGKLWEVNREIVEHKPQVDVYVLDPECDEIPYKMVTGGMSDYPMKVPEGVPFRRTELVLYVKKPKPFYYDLLRPSGSHSSR